MVYDKQIVLIVDDVELNRAFLADILYDRYEILEAADGLEAMEMIRKYGKKINIVLLDVVMPKMDGFTVLLQMKLENWIDKIPVVLISAENSSEYISKGYELGAVDYINRPFDAGIIQKRISNTIMLYAKQKALEYQVAEQIREKEKSNMLMIDILSTVVEFRNGESGLHVLRIRVITEILLEALEKRFPKYALTPVINAMISNAAALHDIGKIAIPEKILNKPAKLTFDEFELMKTHAAIGAKMLDDMRFGREEELVCFAKDICHYHHERWDGRGYPDGLKAMNIPLCAQVVSLADVYDALVSERVYKKAYSHDEAIRMILDGECGEFNPDLITCLIEEEATLERRIQERYETPNDLFDIDSISKEIIDNSTHAHVSDRTMFLFEQERIKYQFLAALSNEILYEYNYKEDTLVFSEQAHKELNVPTVINNCHNNSLAFSFLDREDLNDFRNRIIKTTLENPFLQLQYPIQLPNGKKEWYEFTARSMWSDGLQPEMLGFIGKMNNIHTNKIETNRLKKLAESDSLTGLYNQAAAREKIEEILEVESSSHSALLFLDLDNFKTVNDSLGHMFGDRVLCHTAKIIRNAIKIGDVAARVGGDEFIIFFKDVRNLDIKKRVVHLYNILCNEYEGYEVSVSIGVASFPQDGKTYTDLLNSADKALYYAKHAGKKTYAFYEALDNKKNKGLSHFRD